MSKLLHTQVQPRDVFGYRREIDGLRALAVIPVVLFHAGFQAFRGGFVGVDIFFVISGYLITGIILTELKNGKFSLAKFYERRARRILPALFLVMGTSSVFAYTFMMPDELKNFGQSLLATTFFSNNILLAITSGYWDLASEFKPLLHTWSLGVEEQYYAGFPIFVSLCWAYARRALVTILIVVFCTSLLLANWGISIKPSMAFYVLPTRLWEIVIGALATFYLSNRVNSEFGSLKSQLLSSLGLLLILVSICGFNQGYPAPGFYMLIPTLGACLIILYATEGTLANRLLGSRLMVGIGLISYSFYLWHQPLFAFTRIYSVNPPTTRVVLALIFSCFLLAYITWRYVEQPFRAKNRIRLGALVSSSITLSLMYGLFGYYLSSNYGIPSRIFDSTVKIEDMDKRAYNNRIFAYKKDAFSGSTSQKVLVVGNSTGRDFVNMTIETFNLNNTEIIYRDDLKDCIYPYTNAVAENLYGAAEAIVFASGFEPSCVSKDIAFAKERKKRIFYIGQKHFGYNLNWLIRLDPSERPNQFNPLLKATREEEQQMLLQVPPDNYTSLLAPVVNKDGQIPITDAMGRMLSTDRVHLTKYGAIFFGERVLLKSRYGELLTRK